MQATEADLGAFQACFAANGMPRSLPALRWQYLESPMRRLFVDLALDPEAGERIAGIYAVFPVAFRIAGRVVSGAQSLDTLTDAGYRGRGLFVELAQSVYGRLRDDGFALVYGFPNGNSAHGFFKHLEWVSMNPVPLLVRPLRTRHFLSRLPRVGRYLAALPDLRLPLPAAVKTATGVSIRELEHFGDDTDRVWQAFSSGVLVAVERDQNYLTWRLRQKPGEEYWTFGYYRDGRLLGFVSYSLKNRHGGRVGYVMELIYDPAEAGAGEVLLRHAIRDLARRGGDAVLAWNFAHSPNHEAFAAVGFRSPPDRLRPSELHFGVRSFSADHDSLLAERRNWYISLCDSDTD